MRQKDTNRAKRVIFEIIREAGGTFQNKTNLFKAFWKAHVEFARAGHGQLTAWPIVKMPNGPGIDSFDKLLGELMVEGVVHTDQCNNNGYQGFVFRIAQDSPKISRMAENELAAICSGVEFVLDRTASSVSDESHVLSRSWRNAELGQELNVGLDALTEGEYQQGREEVGQVADIAKTLWGL